MKWFYIKGFWWKAVVAMVLGMVASGLFVETTLAADYYNKYKQCLTDSKHESVSSVKNYACKKASTKHQNACASWLGSATDSRSTVITGSATAATVDAKLWGMCTMKPDMSSRMDIVPVMGGDMSIFACKDGNCNFSRGDWGTPTSKDVAIDVPKFIANAILTTYNGSPAYYMQVNVKRTHSDAGSTDDDYSDIYLVLSDMPDIPPPVIGDLCMSAPWDPTDYNNSGLMHSKTGVDIKIQNTHDRFRTLQYGQWNDNKIYAMPTDIIAWNTCYYGGTPASAEKEVSNINHGAIYRGNDFYPDEINGANSCLNGWGSYKNLRNKKGELWALSKKEKIWENKLVLSGDAQVVWPGDEIQGSDDYGYRNRLYVGVHNGHETKLGDAGQTFKENARTGGPTSVDISCSTPSKHITDVCSCATEEDKGCTYICRECTNGYANGEYCEATVDYNYKSDFADVDVPYNFENYPNVSIEVGEAYSGETLIKIDDYSINVAPRTNDVTVATYATEVPRAKVALYAYVVKDIDSIGEPTANGDGCDIATKQLGAKQCIELWSEGDVSSDKLILNSGAALEGSIDTRFNGKYPTAYRAFDAAAGDYMCFVASVWPASSGPHDFAGDTQMGNTGDNLYRYSEPDCALIMKKPTFQVWGDMFSNPGVSAHVGTKYNVYNYYYSDIGQKYRRVSGPEVYLGSWVENGLIINGSTTTLASGAATAKNIAVVTGSGSTANSICERAPLTIANKNCSLTMSVGGAGIDSGLTNLDEVVDYWLGTDTSGAVTGGDVTLTLGGGSNWQTVTSATGKIIEYLSTSGTVTINASNVSKETTYLVKTDSDVVINGDIMYDNNGYDTLGQVPKVVIYGKNIRVRCDVSEIDAILVATETFDTCDDYNPPQLSNNPSDDELVEWNEKYPHDIDELEERRRSQTPLKVFGSVVSDKMSLKRIYGAAAWNPEAYPMAEDLLDGLAAEVFDYDSSVMLWGEYMSGAAESDTLQLIYLRELSPRY